MKLTKIVSVIIWATLMLIHIVPLFFELAEGAMMAIKVLIVIHFIEFFFYLPLFNKIKGSLLNHFVQVMLFGVLYYWQVCNENAGNNP